MTISVTDQRTIWPGYIYPSIWDNVTAWFQFGRYAQLGHDRTGSIAIMNPGSGPGSSLISDYTGAVNFVRSRGHKVIGYIHTSYAARPLTEVMAEVDTYYNWYEIDGIFVDEMSNNQNDKTYYQGLYSYIKTKPGPTIVVGNPGAPALTDWQVRGSRSVDLVLMFEGTGLAYLSFSQPSWTNNYAPHNFGHIIYECAAADVNNVIAKTRTNRAGYRYITNDTLPNPWDSLAYWPQQATP